MSRKPMTVSAKYGKYTETTILLEDEIKYEFLIDKFISKMENLFNEEEYKNIKYENTSKFNSKLNLLLNEKMNDKYNEKGKERLAVSCNSYKTFHRNFDEVIEKENGKRSVKEERYCINIIKDMEFFFETKFLNDLNNTIRNKNKYIHSLILSLIDIMIESDFFNYIPYAPKSPGYKCYQNQIRMIEDNIKILFKDKDVEVYEFWQEILKPLRRMVCCAEFPGIEFGMWLKKNPALAYFDHAVYNIADKDYQLYEEIITGKRRMKYKGEDVKIHFSFNIGENEGEVRKNIEKRTDYLIKKGIRNGLKYDFEKELRVFYTEFKKAYLKIVEENMDIHSA